MKHLTLIFILFIILCFNLFSQDPITCNESFLDSDWQISGPIADDSYSNMGRIVSIWVAPTNPNYILVGTRTSGLWKSIDGGENWSNLTAFQLPACGVLGIAVYDNNTIDYADDIIYLGTEFNGSEMNVYSVGIAYSNDNGINWQYDYSMDSDADLYYFPFVRTGNVGSQHLFIKPGSDKLLVLNGTRIYTKEIGSGDWTVLKDINDFSIDANHFPTEIDFLTGYPDFMVISFDSGTNDDAHYTSDGGITWNAIPAPIEPIVPAYWTSFGLNTSTSLPHIEGLYILYTYSYSDTVNNQYTISFLYRYNVPLGGSIAITEMHAISGLTSGYASDNAFESRELLVFPDATDMCVVSRGQGELFKADLPTNSNPINFYPASKYSGTNTHADIRAMAYFRIPAENYLFIVHDGGLSRCSQKELINATNPDNNDGLWDNINGNGLTITEFNGISVSELDKNRIFASAIDGNSYLIKKDAAFGGDLTYFNFPNSYDNYSAKISPVNKNVGISNYTGGSFDPASTGKYNLELRTKIVSSVTFPLPAPLPGETIISDRTTNIAFRPFDFDENGNFWMSSVDIFTYDKETTGANIDFPINTFTQQSSSYFKNISRPAFAAESFSAITNYKRIPNYPVNTITTFYISTKGIINNEDPNKLLQTTYNPNISPFYNSVDITPNLVIDDLVSQINSSAITDIEIDVTSPSELWISFGSTKVDYPHPYLQEDDVAKKGKVYFSPDGGVTWYNRSDGLPNYPVLCLTYWPQTDDIIFAGTDVGVYIWHKTPGSLTGEGVWECFRSNLPYCSVNEIEINNCTNSIYASTFGYGIWETPLPNLQADAPLSYNPTTITSDITWTTTRDAYTDIIIKPGAKLTIQNCEIRMPKNGKIIVENGGMLVVDGATIINYCDFWDGIQVWGKGNTEAHPLAGDIYSGAYPVDAGDHGVVRLLNDAKIAMAKTAIATLNAAEGSNPAYYGGIILANEADFLNNIVSIDMRPFDTGVYNTDDDNIASFAYCNFTRNNDLPEATDNLADVYLNDVDGVNFDVCHFLNTFTNCTSVNDTPEGIASTNSTFAVTSELCLVAVGECIIERSSFEGYYRGINAGNSVLCPLLLKLNGVDFTNNERGVLFSRIPNAQVTRCNFYVPDYTDKPSYGLYLETSFNYHIEGNYFTSLSPATSSSFYSSGIFVENNSNKATEIYRNTFKNIEIGIRSQGNNSKLQLTCNSFLPPDIGAAGFIYNIIVTSGVLGNQGICNATITAPAGNKFSPGFHPESEFRIVPVGVTLNYRHHTESVCIPTQYTASQITLQNCGVSVEGDCPSTLPDEPTGGELRVISEAALAIEDAGNLLEVIQSETAKIDGGSTATLISDVLTNVSPTTLVEQLNEASPYISNEVFSTLVSAEPLATADMLTILNLNYPIADTVGELITTSNYEVPEPIVDFLTDNVINDTLIASGYTDLLATIDILNSDRTQLITDATYAYIASEQIDSATLLLASENDDWANQTLIELALIQNDLSQAETLLSNYIAQADPNFATLNSLLVDLKQSERTIMEITAPEESLLRTIATKEYPSGVAAQHILNEIFNEAYPEVIDDIPAPLYRVAESTQFTINENFKIYPNPADDILFLQIMDNNAQAEKIITMYSLTGIKQQSITMPALSSWTWIDCTTMISGIYIIEVLVNGKTLGTQKVVIE